MCMTEFRTPLELYDEPHMNLAIPKTFIKLLF